MPERRERAPSESSAAMGTSAPFAIAARRSSERNLRTRKKVYIPAMGMPKIMITAASPIKLPSIKTLLVGALAPVLLKSLPNQRYAGMPKKVPAGTWVSGWGRLDRGHTRFHHAANAWVAVSCSLDYF